MNGLILQGGGSKGAWQVGFLKAISEMCPTSAIPFNSITGISVGSINASILAMEKKNFRKGVLRLENYWANMSHNNVYDLGKYGVLTSLNNLINSKQSHKFLLNNKPLRQFLTSKLDFDKVQSIAEDKVDPCFLNLHAYNYLTGKNVTFTNSPTISKLNCIQTMIKMNHILASTAIPFVFPSTKINRIPHGDGGLKLANPSQLLIEQGCTNILAISLDNETADANVGSNIFNTIFPDAVAEDQVKITNKNENIKWYNIFNPHKKINSLLIRPKYNIEEAPKSRAQSLPFTLKHTIKALGISKDESSNLLGYISFDKEYSMYLIEAGYKQGLRSEELITNFLKLS